MHTGKPCIDPGKPCIDPAVLMRTLTDGQPQVGSTGIPSIQVFSGGAILQQFHVILPAPLLSNGQPLTMVIRWVDEYTWGIHDIGNTLKPYLAAADGESLDGESLARVHALLAEYDILILEHGLLMDFSSDRALQSAAANFGQCLIKIDQVLSGGACASHP